MFKFLKKEELDHNIYSPVSGHCMDITECSDAVFSSKMLGDGFLVKPSDNVVRSVCDGTVENIFPTKHAIGIKMKNGQNVLIHIGLDTVRLDGRGFTQLVDVNKKVRKGMPLIELDLEYLKANNIDTSIIVVMMNDLDFPYVKENLNQNVEATSKIIKRG